MPYALPFERMISDPRQFAIDFLLRVPAILLGLVLHEAAHAYAAYRCGDPTARMLGRMTLDPRKHLDLFGTIALVFVGFGWARPVPVNPRNLKKPRRDDILVSIAGILTNLALFLISCAAMYLTLAFALRAYPGGMAGPIVDRIIPYPYGYASVVEGAYGTFPMYLYEMLVNLALVNFTLAVFNLLPMPPLDGSHLFRQLFRKRGYVFESPSAARFGQIAVLALVFSGAFGKALGFLLDGTFRIMAPAAIALARAFGL